MNAINPKTLSAVILGGSVGGLVAASWINQLVTHPMILFSDPLLSQKTKSTEPIRDELFPVLQTNVEQLEKLGIAKSIKFWPSSILPSLSSTTILDRERPHSRLNSSFYSPEEIDGTRLIGYNELKHALVSSLPADNVTEMPVSWIRPCLDKVEVGFDDGSMFDVFPSFLLFPPSPPSWTDSCL